MARAKGIRGGRFPHLPAVRVLARGLKEVRSRPTWEALREKAAAAVILFPNRLAPIIIKKVLADLAGIATPDLPVLAAGIK